MTTRRRTWAPAGLALIAVAFPGGAALGLEGWTVTGRVNATLEADSNPGFRRPAPGGAEIDSVSTLGLTVANETPTQKLSFGIDFRYQATRKIDGETETEFRDPAYDLSYALEGPDSLLAFRASQTSLDVENALFLDLDGDEILELIDSSVGTLTRRQASLTYSFGIAAPFGMDLSASRSERDYEDTVDPRLFDASTDTVQAVARFRLSEVATARTTLRHRETRYDDLLERTATADTVQIGLAYEISPALRFNGDIGWTEVEEVSRATGGVIDDRDAVDFSLALAQDLPDGTLTGTATRTVDEDEARTTLRIDRAMEIPGASLSYGAGLSDGPGGVDLIAAASYARELSVGAISASASRIAGADSAGDPYTVTSFSTLYLRPLTPLVDLGLGLDYTTVSRDDEEKSNLQLAVDFTRQLDEDWAWTIGYRARFRTTDGKTAGSNRIVTSIGRSFSLRP